MEFDVCQAPWDKEGRGHHLSEMVAIFKIRGVANLDKWPRGVL